MSSVWQRYLSISQRLTSRSLFFIWMGRERKLVSYQYDLFLSYKRRNPTLDWVRNHFRPLLDTWLPECMDRDPSIFMDEQSIETGEAWPDALREALQVSRFLVCILSPSYFRSDWCLAEWHTFLAREKTLRLGARTKPKSLIIPISFHDGDHFPKEAKRKQQRVFHEWNTPHLCFRDTPNYLNFEREMKDLCEFLAKQIALAPDWDSDWPVETPSAGQSGTTMKLPRLT